MTMANLPISRAAVFVPGSKSPEKENRFLCMAFYRLYFLFDGHIVDSQSFHADDDVHAETTAELAWQNKSVRCDGMELWSDKRRVRCKEAPRNGIECEVFPAKCRIPRSRRLGNCLNEIKRRILLKMGADKPIPKWNDNDRKN